MAYVFFAGCSTTKGSAYACAVYTLIIKVVALIVVGLILAFPDRIEQELTKLSGGIPFTVTGTIAGICNFGFKDYILENFFWFAVIHCSIYFIKAVLLLYAVKNNSRKLMIPWMTGTVQDFCIKLVFISLFLRDGGAGNLLTMFIVVYGMFWFIVMLVYEFFCVASHYHFLSVKQKKEEATKKK